MYVYRYSRWDGSQEALPLDEEDLMEHLADQMTSQGDVMSALRTMIQRGVRGKQGQRLPGIQQILQRLRERRKETTDQYNLGSVLDHIKEQLEEIVALERRGIEERLREVQERYQQVQEQGGGTGVEEQLLERMERMAAQSREYLDQLPPGAAGQIRSLQEYEFMDPEAKERLDQLVRSLQEQVLNAHLQEFSQALQSLTSQDLQSLREMLGDLNRMLEQRVQGGQPDFQQFMDKWGSMFGPNPPSSLEGLLEQMQHQLAQMESLLHSMSPKRRQELQDMLDAAFDDPDLRAELAQLAANLEYLQPMGALRRQYPFLGKDPLTLQEAMDLMDQLQRMEELERQLRRTQHDAHPGQVDEAALRELLGEEALQDFQQLKRLAETLEEAGYIRELGGKFELTPRGMRKIGQKALQEIFFAIKKDRSGSHATRDAGPGTEWTHDTKQYEFGDPFHLHLQKTLTNALFREHPGVPIHIRPEDFEVYRAEHISQASTVLMIDLSLSMAMRGNFLAAKKVALAMDNLIRTQFPRDALYIVGFSTYAREVKAENLAYLSWDEFDPYTNIQHGLEVSQKLLARLSGGTKQIIMISDGEPTAHMEGGQLFLQYPPSPRTLRETLREVKRCTSRGITINTFMLDRSSYLVEFVEQMTKVNRGRVFYTSPERLGQYILVDYYTSRRQALS